MNSYSEQEVYRLQGRNINLIGQNREKLTLEPLDRLKGFTSETFKIEARPRDFETISAIVYETNDTSPLLSSFRVIGSSENVDNGTKSSNVDILTKMNDMFPFPSLTSVVRNGYISQYLP